MEDVSVGMRGLMIDGIFMGKTVTVKEVLQDSIVIEFEEQGQMTLCHISRDQFRLYDPRVRPSAACPYQVGDMLLVHAYPRTARLAVVTGVSERHGRLVVNIDGRKSVESFENVILVSPPRRDVLPDFLEAIERAHPHLGPHQRREFWWVEQLLRRGPWDSDEALLKLGQEYARFLEDSQKEEAEELQRKKREFTETFGPLTHEERVERWCQEFPRWIGQEAFGERFVAEMARRYLSAEELRRVEEEAVRKGPRAFFQLSMEEHVTEQRLRAFAVEQRVLALMMDGAALRRGTERAERRVPLRARYAAWRAQEIEDEEALARERQRARAEVMASADRIRERMGASHGIRVPDHVFDFWACWRGLHPAERKAMELLGVEPIGLLAFFEGEVDGPRGTELDPRLHDRAYRDPPEFFAVARAGEGNTRFGLWYDALTALPRRVACYADYSGRMEFSTDTLLQAVRQYIEQRLEELESREPGDDDWLWLRYALARDALDAAEQSPTVLLPPLEGYRAPTQDDMGALVPPEGAVHEQELESLRLQLPPDELEVMEAWAEAALAECARGDPTKALVLGRDFFWWSCQSPERELIAARLLVAAYRALGRPGLAELVFLHHRHRRREPAAGITARA